MNSISWDSTGRFLLTGVVQPIEQAADARIGQDAGFTLWTFQVWDFKIFWWEDLWSDFEMFDEIFGNLYVIKKIFK